jgi:hypothetical protein
MYCNNIIHSSGKIERKTNLKSPRVSHRHFPEVGSQLKLEVGSWKRFLRLVKNSGEVN